MEQLTLLARMHRAAALCDELYVDHLIRDAALAHNMRVTVRQVRRWKSGQTPIPKIVLVALGAMVADKRSRS